MKNIWPRVALWKVLTPISRPESINPTGSYRILGAHWYAHGLYVKDIKSGSEIQADRIYRVEQGDFVYNRLFAWKGSFAVATEANHGDYVSNEFPCFIVNQEIADSKYLWRYFSRKPTWEEALSLSTGGTPTSRNRLKEEKLLAMEIPLPPLEEQRRIVAHIEELATRIEEARGLRREALEEVELIRATATQQLFEPGKSYNWTTAKLGEVSEIRSGVTLGRVLNGPTVRLPYLRVANVQDGYLNLHTIKEIDILNSEADKWLLQSGDILLTEGGDWDKLGRGTIWRGEIPNCIHQNHIFRVRTNPAVFDPNYLVALISSPYGKSYFQSASKQTTNLASINRRQLNEFKVFRLSLPEQRRIVN
ncbi:MAG TPA: restriction endonuclease subunit S, partial [Methylomirabilota bacterium]|nr:restriction endonuclease subunit S [Methylomirabilota bacterium]